MENATMTNTPNVSRRRLLASMPAVAAAMAPVAATARCRLPAGDDAELIELGEQLEALSDREDELVEALRPAWREYAKEMGQRLIAESKGELTYEESNRQDAEHRKTLGLDQGLDAECKQVQDSIDTLMKRILELPAYTIEGLAVHAAAAAYVSGDLWSTPPNELDWDKAIIRNLIERVEECAELLASA
jgi:hypothetical protein